MAFFKEKAAQPIAKSGFVPEGKMIQFRAFRAFRAFSCVFVRCLVVAYFVGLWTKKR